MTISLCLMSFACLLSFDLLTSSLQPYRFDAAVCHVFSSRRTRPMLRFFLRLVASVTLFEPLQIWRIKCLGVGEGNRAPPEWRPLDLPWSPPGRPVFPKCPAVKSPPQNLHLRLPFFFPLGGIFVRQKWNHFCIRTNRGTSVPNHLPDRVHPTVPIPAPAWSVRHICHNAT